MSKPEAHNWQFQVTCLCQSSLLAGAESWDEFKRLFEMRKGEGRGKPGCFSTPSSYRRVSPAPCAL